MDRDALGNRATIAEHADRISTIETLQIRFQVRIWPGRHAFEAKGDVADAKAMSKLFTGGDKANTLLVCSDPKAALVKLDETGVESGQEYPGTMETWKFPLQSNRTYSLQLRYCIGKFTR